jgi:hypothetical protein
MSAATMPKCSQQYGAEATAECEVPPSAIHGPTQPMLTKIKFREEWEKGMLRIAASLTGQAPVSLGSPP